MLRGKQHEPRIYCKSTEPEALVLLVPGAMLYPDDYSALIEAFMNHIKSSSICLVICSPDWAAIDVANFVASSTALVHDSIENTMQSLHGSEYKDTGILETDKFGRYKNLVVVMHSLSGLLSTGSFAMRKASAVVLLASSISQSVSGLCPALRSFPLPVLSIFGEYDGQQHLAKVAIDVCNSGVLFGETSKPCHFSMVPKCNHASFSNGKRNAARGDISIENVEGAQTIESTARHVVGLIMHFIPGALSDKIRTGVGMELLHQQTQATISLLKGYLEELGRIPRGFDPDNGQHSEMIHVLKYCSGKEMMHVDIISGSKEASEISIHHPGQLARAEEFAVDVQKYILKSMQHDEKQIITVTANVHTDPDNFKFSPVKVRETSTSLYIEIQCLASVPAKGTEYTTVSPFYAMKLSSPEHLCKIKGLPSVEDIFSLAWQRAEQSSAPVLLKRFKEQGHPLTVRNTFHTIPHRWMASKSTLKDGHLTLHTFGTTADNHVRVDDSFDQPGLFCCHVPSIAWCMEYIYVHGLKDH